MRTGPLLLAAAAIAAFSPPPARADQRVNADPPGKWFPANKQNEPTLGQNPTNPLNLVAGSNDQSLEPQCTDTTPSSCSRAPGVSFTGYYASFDGGATWPARCQGHLVLANGAYSVGDPWQAFDSKGNVYFGTLAMPAGVPPFAGPADVYVAKSTDGGCTYATGVKVSATAPAIADDKDAMTADANPDSPFADTVYAVWRPSSGPEGMAQHVLLSRSTDGGATWSNPRPVTAANAPDGTFRQGPSVQVGRDGTVYVMWTFLNLHGFPGAGPSTIRMATSRDGGKTFRGQEIVVAPIADDGVDPLPGTSFRQQARIIPTLAFGPRLEPRTKRNLDLNVAWASHANGHGVVMTARSNDGGATWSLPVVAADVSGRSAFFSSLAADRNGVLSLVFQAVDDTPVGGVVRYDTYLAQSSDGTVWSTPAVISTQSSDPRGSSRESLAVQFIGDYLTAVADSRGGQVFAVWTDARNAAPCPAVEAFRAGTGLQPNVIASCSTAFGDTDIYFTAMKY